MTIEREGVKTEIREYAEEMPVYIKTRKNIDDIFLIRKGIGRLVIDAENEGGYNGTEVDLLDVIEWVKKNKPELLK